MITVKNIRDLIASHHHENQILLSHITSRIQEQEQELYQLLTEYVVGQDLTISTKDILNKLKVRDLEYWYTPLSEISGYSELSNWVVGPIKNDGIRYLGDLVIKGDNDLRRLSGFGRKALIDLKSWLKSIGEELGQELKEYRENKVLLRRFDEKIANREEGCMFSELQYELYQKVRSIAPEVHTVGELATSEVHKYLSERDRTTINAYLRQFGAYLRLGMSPPYRPS